MNLNLWINTIKNIKNRFKNTKFHYKYVNTVIITRKCIDDNFNFASKKIIDHIYSKKSLKFYQIFYDDVIIHLFTPNIDQKIKEILFRYFVIGNFFKEIYDIEILSKVKLFLILSPHKKYFPKKSKNQITFNMDMINSAQCLPTKSITIFRNEECLKTIIHEYVHLINFDYHLRYIPLKNINVNHDVFMSESVAEFFAVIINSVLNNPKNPISSIKKEQQFSIRQSSIILYLSNGITYEELFNMSSKKYISEKTNATAYYIIKTILLLNIEKTIEHLPHIEHIIHDLIKSTKLTKIINKSNIKLLANKRYSARMTIT